MSVQLRVKQVALKYENDEYRIIVGKVIELLNGEYKGKNLTIKGPIPKLFKNEELIVEGKIIQHQKYGVQLEVLSWSRPIPQTNEQLINYFSSSLFKGIGKKTAEKIVKHLGKNAIKKIADNGIKALVGIELSKDKMVHIIETIQQSFVLNDVLKHYADYGIGTDKVLKVYSFCKDVNTIKSNPYLFAKYRVVNFATCDQIAFKQGMFPHAIERIECLLQILLREVINGGDCYIEEKPFINKMINLLNSNLPKDSHVGFSSVISVVEQSKLCVVENGLIYPANLFFAEKIFAREIVTRINRANIKAFHEFEIAYFFMRNGSLSSDEQINAVKTFLKENIMILTGGPGTGKTYTLDLMLKATLELLNINSKDVALVAPTGRAAKRIAQSISNKNVETTTIHRLLGYGREGINDRPYYNEMNKLPHSVVLVDEFSMVDIELAKNLLVALKDDAKLVIMGDPEQLESVGAGNVLKDLLNTNIACVELTKIFRQASHSKIIESAHRLKHGQMIDLTNSSDQYFIQSDLPDKSNRYIVKSVQKLLNQGYSLNDILVLTPMKKGILGVEMLNEKIREAINPANSSKKEIKYRTNIFRVSDKVMYTCNNSELDVYNGDMGIIKNINYSADTITVEFDYHKIVHFGKEEFKNLTLSYASSIHKAQGSQAKIVIMAIAREHNNMLKRNLLNTALTRAEETLIIVGEQECIQKAIQTVTTNKRKTTLTKRINELMYLPSISTKKIS